VREKERNKEEQQERLPGNGPLMVDRLTLSARLCVFYVSTECLRFFSQFSNDSVSRVNTLETLMTTDD
jgi:hypothetical protein